MLIRCELSDPDRNHDRVLVGDELTLRQLGVRHQDTLTLHQLGGELMTGQGSSRELESGQGSSQTQLLEPTKSVIAEENAPNVNSTGDYAPDLSTGDANAFTVSSRISANNADHSYNGLVFDIEALDAYEVEITGIALAGMLGRLVRLEFSNTLYI